MCEDCGPGFYDDEDDEISPFLGQETTSVDSTSVADSIFSGFASGMTSQSCSPPAMIDLAYSKWMLDRKFRHSVDTQFARVTSNFAPENVIASYKELDPHFAKYLFSYGDCVVKIDIGRNHKGSFRVSHSEEKVAQEVAKELAEKFLEAKEEDSDARVEVGFWYSTPKGPNRFSRFIDAPALSDLQRNYSVSVKPHLDRLGSITTLPEESGRIVLLHGKPGTGKTTLLRSLAREWKKWANFDVVVDPENLLADASYLMSVVSASHNGSYSDEEEEEKWRVLLLEDSGELTRKDAKERTGQGLSRLLNMADGILGRGQRVIFAITTNESLGELHDAIIRPGRCLVQFEVPELTAEEASAWLGKTVQSPMTLADLYAEKQGDPVLVKNDNYRNFTGQYI